MTKLTGVNLRRRPGLTAGVADAATGSTAGLVLLALVCLLSRLVLAGGTARIDAAGLLAMAGGPQPFWRLFARAGDTGTRLVVAGLAVALLLTRRAWARAATLAATILGGIALNEAAKVAFTRSRPGLLPHLDHVSSYSFPSGHAAGATILGLALALHAAPPRWRRPALVAAFGYALLVGLSRVALAVHWPSDVLAGWTEGVGWVLLVAATAAAIGRWAARRGAPHG